MEGRGRYQLQPQLSVSVPHLTKLGGATGVRTPDLIAASDALSQLSYNPLVDVSCRLRCHLTTCCLSSLITSVLFSCTHSYDLSNNVQCRSVSFASSSCDSHPREQQRTQLNRALLSCSGKPSTDKGIWRRMWESNPPGRRYKLPLLLRAFGKLTKTATSFLLLSRNTNTDPTHVLPNQLSEGCAYPYVHLQVEDGEAKAC